MRRLCIIALAFFCFTAAVRAVSAEELHTAEPQENTEPSAEEDMPEAVPQREEFAPRFRGRAVSLDISARLVEQGQTMLWYESHRKETLLGRPVRMKLVGANVIVSVQFTPYLRRTRNFLVAQGEIWMDIPDQGLRYHTTMQTIPVVFGEPVYFFPLGSIENNDIRIEIILTIESLHPYE